jgi:hypothetical protein
MAIERKVALERLATFQQLTQRHLQKIIDHPGHSSQNHWRHEVRVWLGIMEAMVEHVGKKTAAEWRPILDEIRAQLEAQP